MKKYKYIKISRVQYLHIKSIYSHICHAARTSWYQDVYVQMEPPMRQPSWATTSY